MPIKCPVAPLSLSSSRSRSSPSGACATRWRSPTSRLCRRRSPSRSAPSTWATCSSSGKIALESDYMVERIDQRGEAARVLRRARGALRPAGDRPAQHGRRLCRPGSATSSTSCRSTSTRLLSPHLRRTSGPSATRTTSRRRRQDQSRTSRSRCSSTTSSSTWPESRSPARSTATRTASSRPATARRCSIDFNYDTEPLPGRFPVPGVGPMEPAQGDEGQPPGQARVPLGLLERAACPVGPMPIRRRDVHVRAATSPSPERGTPRRQHTPRSTPCLSRPSTATRSTSTPKAS